MSLAVSYNVDKKYNLIFTIEGVPITLKLGMVQADYLWSDKDYKGVTVESYAHTKGCGIQDILRRVSNKTELLDAFDVLRGGTVGSCTWVNVDPRGTDKAFYVALRKLCPEDTPYIAETEQGLLLASDRVSTQLQLSSTNLRKEDFERALYSKVAATHGTIQGIAGLAHLYERMMQEVHDD